MTMVRGREDATTLGVPSCRCRQKEADRQGGREIDVLLLGVHDTALPGDVRSSPRALQ